MHRREFVSRCTTLAGAVALGPFSRGAAAFTPQLTRITMRDGASIALEESGSGPSLLLVNGSGSTRQAWAAVAPQLASSFHIYAMDRRGHGDSTDGPSYSMELEAQDVVRALRTLPAPVYLAAHSYGAIVALEALRDSPEVTKAVLYEPPLPVAGGAGHDSPETVCSAVAKGDNEAALLAFYRDYAHMPATFIATVQSSPSWPARVKLAPTLCRETQAMHGYTMDAARFNKVATPTLFLLGGASARPMGVSVRAGVAALPHGSLRILPGQQHDAMYSAPKLVSDSIKEFLLG